MKSVVGIPVVALCYITGSVSASGILASVECKGKFAAVTFSTNSLFANETFMLPDHTVSVRSRFNDENDTLCTGSISSTKLGFTANYVDCKAIIVDIQLPNNNDVQNSQINFEATDLYWNGQTFIKTTYDFDTRCTYAHSEVINGNGTVINGGGGNSGGGGNNNGHVSVAGVTIGFATVKASNDGSNKVTLEPITESQFGAPVDFIVEMGAKAKENFNGILPYYCAFSDKFHANDTDATVLPFIDAGCPVYSMKDPAQKMNIVNKWTAPTTQASQFIVNFNAFKYTQTPDLYTHCTINLCINDDCNVDNTDCGAHGWDRSTKTYSYTVSKEELMAHHLEMMALGSGKSKKNGFATGTTSVKIGEGSDNGMNQTVWFAVIGVVGGLFVVSLFVVGALVSQKKKRRAAVQPMMMAPVMMESAVPPVMAPAPAVVPFQMPRARLDPETLPGSSAGSVYSSSHRSNY